MDDLNDEFLTDEQVAAALNIGRQTLANWRTRKLHLPFVKVGAGVRYRRSEVENFVRAHTVAVASGEQAAA